MAYWKGQWDRPSWKSTWQDGEYWNWSETTPATTNGSPNDGTASSTLKDITASPKQDEKLEIALSRIKELERAAEKREVLPAHVPTQHERRARTVSLVSGADDSFSSMETEWATKDVNATTRRSAQPYSYSGASAGTKETLGGERPTFPKNRLPTNNGPPPHTNNGPPPYTAPRENPSSSYERHSSYLNEETHHSTTTTNVPRKGYVNRETHTRTIHRTANAEGGVTVTAAASGTTGLLPSKLHERYHSAYQRLPPALQQVLPEDMTRTQRKIAVRTEVDWSRLDELQRLVFVDCHSRIMPLEGLLYSSDTNRDGRLQDLYQTQPLQALFLCPGETERIWYSDAPAMCCRVCRLAIGKPVCALGSHWPEETDCINHAKSVGYYGWRWDDQYREQNLIISANHRVHHTVGEKAPEKIANRYDTIAEEDMIIGVHFSLFTDPKQLPISVRQRYYGKAQKSISAGQRE